MPLVLALFAASAADTSEAFRIVFVALVSLALIAAVGACVLHLRPALPVGRSEKSRRPKKPHHTL